MGEKKTGGGVFHRDLTGDKKGVDLKNGLGSGRAIRDRGEGVPALRVPVSGRRGSVPLCWGAGAAGDGGPRPGRRQGAKGRLSTEGQEPLELHLQQVLGGG